MQPIAFDPASDLSPLPFEIDICHLAQQHNNKGLPRKPHVGCFVWSPAGR